MSSATNKRYVKLIQSKRVLRLHEVYMSSILFLELLTQYILFVTSVRIRDISSNPKLKDVYTALYDATDQWFDIGLQLDIDSDDLERIEAKFQNNTERLRKMIIVRLNQGDLTWDHITEALENRTIDQKVIADEIRRKYIAPQPTTTTPVKRGTCAVYWVSNAWLIICE